MNPDLIVRLEALERSNRRLRRCVAIIGVALLAVLVTSQASPKPQDIEARRFVVRDAEGRVRAVLGMQPRLRGQSKQETPALRLDSEEGSACAFLGTDSPLMWDPKKGETSEVGGQLVLFQGSDNVNELSPRGVLLRNEKQLTDTTIRAGSIVASGQCVVEGPSEKPWGRDQVELRLEIDPHYEGGASSGLARALDKVRDPNSTKDKAPKARDARIEINRIEGRRDESLGEIRSLFAVHCTGSLRASMQSDPSVKPMDRDYGYDSSVSCSSISISRPDDRSCSALIQPNQIELFRAGAIGPFIELGSDDDSISPRLVLRDKAGTDRAIIGTCTTKNERTGDLRTTGPASVVLFDAQGSVQARLPN